MISPFFICEIGEHNIMLQVKNNGLMDSIKPLLDVLINANIRISDSLYHSILEQVGEL